MAAARFRALHRLAYADAFAVAAAEQLGAVLVTGAPEIVGLTGTVQIEPIGRAD